MKIFTFILLLTLVLSCKTRDIKYNRERILKKYSSNYVSLLDNEKIDLKTIYLDKNNIKKVQIDKRKKELKISQLKYSELLAINNLNIDSLNLGITYLNDRNIELLIINKTVVFDSVKNIRIEPNAIKSINIISAEKMNNMTFCKSYEGDVLVINTK